MTNPLVVDFNAETGEITQRDMSAAEYTEYKAHQSKLAASAIEQQKIPEAKAARDALLTQLGFTPEMIASL